MLEWRFSLLLERCRLLERRFDLLPERRLDLLLERRLRFSSDFL